MDLDIRSYRSSINDKSMDLISVDGDYVSDRESSLPGVTHALRIQ